MHKKEFHERWWIVETFGRSLYNDENRPSKHCQYPWSLWFQELIHIDMLTLLRRRFNEIFTIHTKEKKSLKNCC